MNIEELRERLISFREAAVDLEIPAEEVDRWIGMVRPSAVLSEGKGDVVAARFGGPARLPVGAPHPPYPYVAAVDLAALPQGSTDLPLPSDGHLLLFAWPRDEGDGASHGEVVYVPAGTPVAEWDKHDWDPEETPEDREIVDAFPEGDLRVRTEPSLPYHFLVELPDGDLAPLPGFPHSEELAEEWESACRYLDLRGPLHIGGYADEEAIDLDPLETIVHCARAQAEQRGGEPVSENVEDWALLASWSPDLHLRDVAAGSSVHWAIQRKDLAAGRFERTFTTVYWNP